MNMIDEKNPLFILAGNGPYENRGCEAIVRGTTKILREHFKDPRFICLSHFQSEEQYREQCLRENDDAIVHLASCKINKKWILQNIWKLKTWGSVFKYSFDRNAFYYANMLPYLEVASAVLSVGGDNYSLDYGVPTLYTSLDDLVLAHERPLVIWGASVGQFNAVPDYERYMSDHLQKVNGIFARESATIEYLKSIGVMENVCPVADPAFLMDPVQPEEGISIEEGAIGLNLSPLIAKYVPGGYPQWSKMAAEIVEKVSRRIEKQVYLIPHVTTPNSNDYTFMRNTLSLISEKNANITIISTKYNAAEIKWIISQMAFFAGARTHATIAALSSGVPTLSFAYSIKTQGINQDIFGHTDYCMNPKDLKANNVANRIESMLDQEASIRMDICERIPEIQASAKSAGIELKRLIRSN